MVYFRKFFRNALGIQASFLVSMIISFQGTHLLCNVRQIHTVYQGLDQLLAFVGKTFAGFLIRNGSGAHVVFRSSKAVADGSALISQSENIIKRLAGLRILMVISGGQRHIFQTVPESVGAYSNGAKLSMLLNKSLCSLTLHGQIHVKNGDSGFIKEISYHRTAGHMGRAMKADVNLAFKALTQQAVGNCA